VIEPEVGRLRLLLSPPMAPGLAALSGGVAVTESSRCFLRIAAGPARSYSESCLMCKGPRR